MPSKQATPGPLGTSTAQTNTPSRPRNLLDRLGLSHSDLGEGPGFTFSMDLVPTTDRGRTDPSSKVDTWEGFFDPKGSAS